LKNEKLPNSLPPEVHSASSKHIPVKLRTGGKKLGKGQAKYTAHDLLPCAQTIAKALPQPLQAACLMVHMQLNQLHRSSSSGVQQ
jgi:hypothetical protein